MLLTRASEYALLSLETIVKSDGPIGAEQIANNLHIPKSFLAKILQNLTKNNILVSVRGAQGGYRLSVDPKELSIYDIIAAAEGKRPTVFDCVSYAESCPNGAVGGCAISPFIAKFQYKIDLYLQNLTLYEIFYE